MKVTTDIAFRNYNRQTKKVTVHRDVVFWEPRAPKTYHGAGNFQIGEPLKPYSQKQSFQLAMPCSNQQDKLLEI
jgi:hypothetical protein